MKINPTQVKQPSINLEAAKGVLSKLINHKAHKATILQTFKLNFSHLHRLARGKPGVNANEELNTKKKEQNLTYFKCQLKSTGPFLGVSFYSLLQIHCLN